MCDLYKVNFELIDLNKLSAKTNSIVICFQVS